MDNLNLTSINGQNRQLFCDFEVEKSDKQFKKELNLGMMQVDKKLGVVKTRAIWCSFANQVLQPKFSKLKIIFFRKTNFVIFRDEC